MQGIYINFERPKSKKAIKDQIATDPSKVRIEATSLHGNEFDGVVSEAPDGKYHFCGPDPYTKRNFYGTITVNNGTIKVS